MHQLAGEVADGVILTSIATPAPIQHAKNMLNRGAEIAGRDPAKSTIAASVIYAVAENAAEAAQAAKEDILFYLGYPEIDPLLEQSGFMQEAETIRRVNRERGKGNVLALVNERMLENLAIFGEARHCRAKLEELIGAGLDVPIIRVSNVPYAEREKKQAFLRALDSLRHFCGGRWAMQRFLSPLSCYTWWASPPAWGTRWLGRLSFPALPRSWGLKLGSSG
jgi:alkanesulfonate monooxygenase SsuD/methylene tetrahydromethanopterin reductase-like flavin-dependent oxidoreductase (luciferase family)